MIDNETDTQYIVDATRISAMDAMYKSATGTMPMLAVGMLKILLTIIFIFNISITSISTIFAVDDTSSLEQKAFKEAVDRVAPSVVRIETLGGLEQVEDVQFGSGPTTGLIVDPDGYIVSSAFAFSNKPTSIIVRLSDGTRKAAKLVATDHVRMYVLLKIDTDKPLPVCQIAPESEMRVGQWSIALGRTFEGDQPNISIGILSAKNRIWGKALQTDASISPNNYGGPLVDIHGRVMGLIVSLSPESANEVAGYEWYDSGIGFAIPADHIQKKLPQLKKGEDLHQGFIGLGMKSQNVYTGEPVIAVCRAKSPAAEAGLKSGDRIIAIEGREIGRTAEFREEINRRYAGDKMKLTVLRDKERLQLEITLADKVPAYQQPFLGILPMRDNGKNGLKIRYIFPDSPAAKLGMIAGDEIVSFGGKQIKDRDSLIEVLLEFQTDQEVALEVLRNDKKIQHKVVLGGLNLSMPPAVLPPACEKQNSNKDKDAKAGTINLSLPEYQNDAFAYVPEKYDSNKAYGLVMWLHGESGLDWKKTIDSWKPLCDQHDLILVAPKSIDARKWKASDIGLVNQLIMNVIGKYNIDPMRIVVHGQESGGVLASNIAFRNRRLIRAEAIINAPSIALPQENDPQYRFAVYIASSKKLPGAKSVEKVTAKIREMNIPLIEKQLVDQQRYLTADELSELARWIDMLDAI